MQKKITTPLFLFFCCFLTPLFAQVQISGIINKYARVIDINLCNATINVNEAANFQIGQKVLIIQINGAKIDQSSGGGFGSVEDIKEVGKYEVNEVTAIVGSTLSLRYALRNPYDYQNAAVQCVTFPSFNTVTIADTLRPLAWNGFTGGILAFEAQMITLNAPIYATGAGFRGAQFLAATDNDCSGGSTGYDDYTFDARVVAHRRYGAYKGEGIALPIIGKELGRGAIANGGGGGNDHKTGGGGGANIGNGGVGGQNKVENTFKILSYCRGKFAGIGGRALPVSDERLFMGGGGGAGHGKANPTTGANGGGIILIKANTLIGNGKNIEANGANAQNATLDGAGGGGGAGSVVLQVENIEGITFVQAIGGNGGSVDNNGQDRCFGPGGGGSGGRIILNKNSVGFIKSIASGIAGKTRNSTDCDESTNSAAAGKEGLTSTRIPSIVVATEEVQRNFTITQQPPQNPSVCEGEDLGLIVQAEGVNIQYQWQINREGQNVFVNLIDDETYKFTKTATLAIRSADKGMVFNKYRCIVRYGCDDPQAAASSDTVSLTVLPNPEASFSADTLPNSNTIRIVNTSQNAETFAWNFGDGNTSNQNTPSHTYARQGGYVIRLVVSNFCDVDTFFRAISLNSQPKAAFNSTTDDVCTPATLTFDNTSSNNSTSFEWVFAGGIPNRSSDRNPNVTYQNEGLYDVMLIAKNANGADTFRREGYVRVLAKPSVSFNIQQNRFVVSFKNQTVGTQEYIWDFGDDSTSTAINPTHTYKKTGKYPVTLRAFNSCGLTSKVDTVIITNNPIASFNASPIQGCLPLTTNFNNTSQFADRYEWRFQGGNPSTSTDKNPEIQYDSAGIYDVFLKVFNPDGKDSIKISRYIKAERKPIPSFTFTENSGRNIQFNNTSQFATEYRWNFGDGSAINRGENPNYTYAQNGVYNVTLQALNSSCGASFTKQISVGLTPIEALQWQADHAWQIFPNPTTGALNMDFQETLNDDLQLWVASIDGSVKMKETLNRENLQQIDLTPLPNGVYFLYFLSEKGRVTKKVMKM